MRLIAINWIDNQFDLNRRALDSAHNGIHLNDNISQRYGESEYRSGGQSLITALLFRAKPKSVYWVPMTPKAKCESSSAESIWSFKRCAPPLMTVRFGPLIRSGVTSLPIPIRSCLRGPTIRRVPLTVCLPVWSQFTFSSFASESDLRLRSVYKRRIRAWTANSDLEDRKRRSGRCVQTVVHWRWDSRSEWYGLR